jgi:hypothetical protein
MDEKTRERVFDRSSYEGPDKDGPGTYDGVRDRQAARWLSTSTANQEGNGIQGVFPAIEAQPDTVPTIRREEIVRGGTETILLAEDENPSYTSRADSHGV